MTKEDYFLYQEKINELLNLIREKISSNTLNGIEHYLEHAEIEMAYELLCLEIINKDIRFSQDKKNQLLNLAKILKLNENSVYEPHFWKKLNAYLSKI